MKKRIISLFLSLLLCFSLATTALAAGGFDATVTVDRSTEGQISVTVSATDSILAEKVPTLTVSCDFENADVLFGGNSIDCTIADGQVTFPVAAKGIYVIVALHEVTFHSDNAVTTRAVRHGVAITEPTAPTRVGYTFGGWYIDETCQGEYDFSSPVTGNITLYARWNVNVYTITFKSNGSVHAIISQDYGTAINAPADPTRSGYWYFDGWDEEIPATMPAENMTITAQWYYDEPYYPSVPVTPPTTTEKTENEDGSITTTVTNNKTGTVTETTENADGSTTTVETQKNGTVTKTVEGTDGSTQVTETKAEVTVKEDGSTETVTNSTTTATDAAGNVTTSTTTATETTVTKEDGTTVTEKVEETKSESTAATVETKTTATTTATEEKTETVAVTEETVTKADGTTETKTTTTIEIALADGTVGTATTDESGKTEATVTISEEAAASDEPVALPIPAVTTNSEAASTITVTTNSEETITVAVPVADGTGAGTVAVIVNADGTETVVTSSKVTENSLEVTVPDGATIKVVDNSVDFADVNNTDWEKDAVDFTSARGIMQGTSTGENATFDSKMPTTRAMVWTMLARLSGVDTTPAAGENWWTVGQKWAMENGISDGTMHDSHITREQLATMLHRYAGAPTSDHEITHFDDHHETSDWALEAKQWAVENGIIKGVGQADGSVILDPQGNAIRSHVAQMFMNFMTKVGI